MIKQIAVVQKFRDKPTLTLIHVQKKLHIKKKTKGKLTGENKDEDEHDGGVAEVEDHGGHALHLQLGEVEVDGVDEEVERSATGRQVAPPPPSVVLRFVNR